MILYVFGASICLIAEDKPSLLWSDQIGSDKEDRGTGISVDDASNVYVCGYASGDMLQKNAGSKDAFIVKYSPAGEKIWGYQLGTEKSDWIFSVRIGSDGNCYFTGETSGVLGEQSYGSTDCFVGKLNPDGELIWIQQFGSSGADNPKNIILDEANNVYVCGYTSGQMGEEAFGSRDMFLAKYSGDGDQQWVKQYGTPQEDGAWSLTLDANNDIYLTGYTRGSWGADNAGSTDNLILHLNNDGEVVKVIQNGTGGDDGPLAVAVNVEGTIFMAGSSNNRANLIAMDQDGNMLWERLYGVGGWSGTWSVELLKDGSGDMIVGGCQNYDKCQAFTRRYTKEGELIWQNALFKNGSKLSCGRRIAIDKQGCCCQTGFTNDDLFGEALGSTDAQVFKLGDAASSVKDARNIPEDFMLFQNHPNPFNPETKIEYRLNKESYVLLRVYNVAGEKIRTLVNSRQAAGLHEITWDAKNDSLQPVSSGIYVYQMECNGQAFSRQMTYLK